MTNSIRTILRPFFVPLLAASTAVGCAASSGDAGDPGSGADMGAAAYAMVTLVWSDEGPTGYVSLSDSLDLSEVSLDHAREFPGYTSVGVSDGRLLVNPSWEDPTIERYRINDQLEWSPEGTLSFANEGVEAVSFHTQYLRKDHAAYLDVDVTGRVVWDPIDFAIDGTESDDLLPTGQDGLDLFANWNRTQFVFGDTILRPFSYHDQDWFRWSEGSSIVIYDRATHSAVRRVDAPCPGLDSITEDESGNLYLGTREYSALQPLMGTGVAPCAVRLTPDLSLDEDWHPDLSALAGGRHLVNFRYVGDGKAIGAVLHAEEYGEDFDFASLAENVGDFWATATQFHRLWVFDLDDRSATPVSGIDDFEFINPGFFHAVLDERVFLFLGDGNNGSNNFNQTIVYELADDGTATRRFEAPGSVTQWVKVR